MSKAEMGPRAEGIRWHRSRLNLAPGVWLLVSLCLSAGALGSLFSACSKTPDQLVEQGTLALKEDKGKEAEAAFQKALELNPLHPQALYGLGWFYHTRRDAAAARIFFERCIEAAPGYYGGYKGLGSLHLAQGFYPEAEATLQKALELAPDEASILGSLGYLYLVTRRLDLAESSFKRALALDPSRGELHYMLAELRLKQGALDEALTEIQAAKTRPMEELKFRSLSATLEGQLLLQKALKGLPEAGVPTPTAEVAGRLSQLDAAAKALEVALETAQDVEKQRIYQLERKVRLARARLAPPAD